MIKKNELAESMYNALILYKKEFKKFQDDRMRKIKKNYNKKNAIITTNNLMAEFFIDDTLLSIVTNNKKDSVERIMKYLDDKEIVNEITGLVENAIDIFTPLNEIDDTMLFFYDKVDKKIYKEVVIEKFGNGYLKYWDLFVLMNDLENNIINYRQSLTH